MMTPTRRRAGVGIVALALILPAMSALTAAAQETCPAVELDKDREAALIEDLNDVASAEAAAPLNARLWKMWTKAPDQKSQALLDRGMSQIRMGDLGSAQSTLDDLIAYCPDYAEGFNQRAFAAYLRRDLPAALEDIDKALARNPDHVGALSGRALTLMGMGRDREALETLEDALARNPWLSERALVPVLEERLGAEDL